MEAALAEALTEVPSVHTVFSLRRFGGAVADPARDLDWAETVGKADPDFPRVPVKADDAFLIAYTSGTTGTAQGRGAYPSWACRPRPRPISCCVST